MFRLCAALVLTLAALTACSSVEASTPPRASAATPSLPCTLPYGTQVALVWPQPGKRAAAGSAPVVLVASQDLPKTVSVVAVSGRGTATPGGPLERTARPAKAKHGAVFPNPVYYRAGSVALKSKRHYTIALDDLAQNGCAPYAAITGNARFST